MVHGSDEAGHDVREHDAVALRTPRRPEIVSLSPLGKQLGTWLFVSPIFLIVLAIVWPNPIGMALFGGFVVAAYVDVRKMQVEEQEQRDAYERRRDQA